MIPILQAIEASTDFAQWVILTSGDKDFVRLAKKIIDMNETAFNRVVELEKEKC